MSLASPPSILTLALLAAALQGPARAMEAVPTVARDGTGVPETLAAAVGSWDFAREGGGRRCTVTLADTRGPAGRSIRFPAGCRRALPILGGVAGWLFADRGIRLVDGSARAVLAFSQDEGGGLSGRADNGDAYTLARAALVPTALDASAEPKPPVEGGSRNEDVKSPAPAASGSAVVALGGSYVLDRGGDTEVCRLELAPAPVNGEASVRLLPGCRDSGFIGFDPVSWRMSGTRMVLTARRGQTTVLVAAGEGRWRRERDTGAPFILRQAGP